MKCNLPHPFFQEIKKYSLDSLLYQVAFLASKVFCEENYKTNKKFNFFTRISPPKPNDNFSAVIENRKILVAQTWLIDMAYEIIAAPCHGTKKVTQDEFLDLYVKFCDYTDKKDKEIKQKDILLRLFGFWGEQIRFQRASSFFEIFAREKYILEQCSSSKNIPSNYRVDIKENFKRITELSTDDYSFYMFLIWSFVSNTFLFDLHQIDLQFDASVYRTAILKRLIIKYSIPIEEIKKSSLKRQIFYTKPFIRFNNKIFLSVNPFLILNCASNSIYWEFRNFYYQQNSQFFVNAFGYYFEEYVREILEHCLPNDCYHQISPGKKKLADWQLNLGDYIFLIEQKSTISYLQIKQSETDISKMKDYMVKTWGEAVRQLESTQTHFQLKAPIKIVLLYEDYYQCDCLNELFRIDKTCPKNDGRYWLLTIREFESLMNLYRTNMNTFDTIISEKLYQNQSADISIIMGKHKCSTNQYQLDFGIDKEFTELTNMLKKQKTIKK